MTTISPMRLHVISFIFGKVEEKIVKELGI